MEIVEAEDKLVCVSSNQKYGRLPFSKAARRGQAKSLLLLKGFFLIHERPFRLTHLLNLGTDT